MEDEKKMTKEWLVGFIEGEGNFHVALTKNFSSHSWKFPFEYYPMPQFRIFLREDDLEVLERIKTFLGVGKIYKKKTDYQRDLGFKSRDQYAYTLSGVKDLLKLKEMLAGVQFFTKKRKDMDLFFRILDLKIAKKHLTREGYNEIIEMANKMNSGMRENFKPGSQREIYINKKNSTVPRVTNY